MGAVLNLFGAIEDAGECPTCGVRFGMPPLLLQKKRENGTSFYCPNGHSMSYTKSEVDRLKAELEQEKKRREAAEESRSKAWAAQEHTERRRAATAGVLTRVKNRVGNGVCPCCNRTFQNLQRHMQTKHPKYRDEIVEE